MIKTSDINRIVEKHGNSRENLMLIIREMETVSGKNFADTGSLKILAEIMKIPRSAVAGFVSFYTMFSTKERAKYIIRVCKSGPCHIMGSTTVFDAVKKILGIDPGGTTADGVFHLEKCECLGVCSEAPAMMINYDIHGRLTEKKLEEIFKHYRLNGPSLSENSSPEAEGKQSIIYSSRHTGRLTENIGRIEPLSIDSYLEHDGYKSIQKCLNEYKPADIISIMKESGLRGRGGAGFPAGMKWSFAAKGDMQKYVICNADEGEPGTFKDRILMEENPHSLIEGMMICGYAIHSSLGCIYIRGEYKRSIERLRNAIDQAKNKGILGNNLFGTNFSFDLFIKEGGGAYVCGEETSLINSMEGKRGYPRFKPPFPGESGFKNLPSNVNNVETLCSVPLIIGKGADWYKSAGSVKCYGTKLYSLSGMLNVTGLVEAPMGTPMRELINEYGGGIKNGKKFKFAQAGGSAGGILGEDLMDLPLDYDKTVAAGVTLGSGVLLVADEDSCPVDFMLQILGFFEHESCGQCVPCRTGTGQLHYLIRKFAMRTAEAEDIDLMVGKSDLMRKASLCALGQSPALPLTTMLKYFKDDFIRHTDHNYNCPKCDESLRCYYNGQIGH